MDDLIETLKKLTTKFEEYGLRTFQFEYGEDISNLIKELKTTGDIIELAKRIIDGTIPGTELFQEFEIEKEDYAQHNIEANNRLDRLHSKWEKADVSDDESEDDIYQTSEFIKSLEIVGDWAYLSECLEE